MADNYTANAGTGGNTFASDDISGVHYPRVVPVHGIDGGSKADTSSSNPLPVVDSAAGVLLANLTTMDADTSALAGLVGASVYRKIALASTNTDTIKASAGKILGWHITNLNAAARRVKLYNKASAPTIGSDTPIITIEVAAGSATAIATSSASIPGGIACSAGIAIAMVAGQADNDTNALSAGDVVANIWYV